MLFRKRKPTWPVQFVQDEQSVLRYLELVAKAWVRRDEGGFMPMELGGGEFGRRVAAAPPPRALKPRGVINIRRAR